jgi:hypothetical protein
MPKLKSSDSTIVSVWERKFANASIEGQSLLLADPSQELIDCYNRLLESGRLHKSSVLLSHRVRDAARIVAKKQKEGGSLVVTVDNVTTIPSGVDNNNILASSQMVKKAAAADEGQSPKGTECAMGKTSGEAEVMSRSDRRTADITAIETIFGLLTEKVGEDACNTLKGKIMACRKKPAKAKASLLFDLEITARDLMKSHPDLLEQFLCYLPKKVDEGIQGPQTRGGKNNVVRNPNPKKSKARGGKKGGTKSAIERNREDNNSKDEDVSVVIGSHTKGRGHAEALSILTRYCEGLNNTDIDGFNVTHKGDKVDVGKLYEMNEGDTFDDVVLDKMYEVDRVHEMNVVGKSKEREDDDDLSEDWFETMNDGYNEGDTVNEMKGKGVYKSKEREEDDEFSVDDDLSVDSLYYDEVDDMEVLEHGFGD